MTLLPDSIREISGPVSRPEAILRDDSSHTLLGRPDILAEIHYPELARQHGVIEVGVRRR